jgi:hypothetical protein
MQDLESKERRYMKVEENYFRGGRGQWEREKEREKIKQ